MISLNSSKVVLCSVLCTLLSLSAFTVRAESVAEPVVPAVSEGVVKECINEPVFGGKACIYQANVAAEKTVVLVHGHNGRALTDWGKLIPVLAEKYHVLTFDLPGFGNSDKAVAYYSPAEYAKFVHYVTERYAHGRFVLVGHSMGGAIALRYTSYYSAQIERLVLVDVAGVLHRMAYARQLADGWVTTNGGGNGKVASFSDKMSNKFLSKIEPITGPISRFITDQIFKRELLDVNSSVISAMTLANEDLSDALVNIDLPAMIIWGAEDSVAPMRTAQVLQAYLPDARFEVIAGAAHVSMIDQPGIFNGLLVDYLGGVDNQLEVASAEDEPKPESIARSEVCRKATGKVYQGIYDTLTITGCSQVVIKNATIRELIIRSSKVVIENSEIISDKTALSVTKSDLVITASRLSGETAIYTSGSRIDLAGVKLVGSKFSVQGKKTSSLVFSISEIDSPLATRSIHEFVKVNRKHPL